MGKEMGDEMRGLSNVTCSDEVAQPVPPAMGPRSLLGPVKPTHAGSIVLPFCLQHAVPGVAPGARAPRVQLALAHDSSH